MRHRKGYLNPLHFAACKGDLSKAKWLILTRPRLLNKKDRYGMTPLHYAVMHSKLVTAKLLIDNGARLNVTDCDGYPPIFYAKNRRLHRWLLLLAAKAHVYPSTLHQAAFKGDLQKIKANLKCGIDKGDSKGLTPLHYAVIARQRKAVAYLLKKGADPFVVDCDQYNMIDYAKSKNRHTPFSRFLKSKIGLSKERILASIRPLLTMLKAKFTAAKWQQKKLMILLGESHGDYRLRQIEKVLLSQLSKIGIRHLFVETHKKSSVINDEYAPMINKKTQRMAIYGIDNHPKRETASVNDRNVVMKEELTARQTHGVMITGLYHLYGLMKDKKTRLPSAQFNVVGVNLTASFASENTKDCEALFAFQENEVFQFKLK